MIITLKMLKLIFTFASKERSVHSMIRRCSFILVTAFLWPVITLSQSRLDSLKNLLDDPDPARRVETYCEIAEIYWQSSYDSSLLMATNALNLAEEIGNMELIATSLNMTGIAFYLIGDFASAMDHYFQALPISKEM